MNLGGRKCFGAVLLLVAFFTVGCNDYYIPPPPISITLSPQPALTNCTNTTPPVCAIPLTTQTKDSSGNIVAGTIQFTASVYYASNMATWYVNDIPGGKPAIGTISSSGLYTAPSVAPTPNTVVIKAAATADQSHVATVSVELHNPEPSVTSVTVLPSSATGCPATSQALPAAVAGLPYVLDVEGSFFFPGSTQVSVGGVNATVDTQNSSATKLCVPVSVNRSGVLSVVLTNPSTSGPINPVPPNTPGAILSEAASPAASSSIAVLIGVVATPSGGSAVYGTKAYVPRTARGTVDVVNADAITLNNSPASTTSLAIIKMPSGLQPIAAAANPAQNTVAVISSNSASLVMIDTTTDTVTNTFDLSASVSGSATFSDGSCEICAIVVDADRNQAVLSAASGYVVVDLASGVSSKIPAPASENFAYDALSQTIYAPSYGGSGNSGTLIVINNRASTATMVTYSPPSSIHVGTQLDAAAIDAVTHTAVVSDESSANDVASGQYFAINFNGAAPSGNTVSAPITPFTVTAAANCGAVAWDAVTVEPSTHNAFFANEGACVGVAGLPASAGTGAPATPASMRWGNLGAGPDGVPWASSAAPHSLISYVGSDGRTYALALRNDQLLLARFDLAKFASLTPIQSGADANQVDPAVKLSDGTYVVTYTPLQ